MNKSKKLNSNILRKVVLIGLSIGNIAFIGYVLTIGYYNTILVDDFYFLAKLKDHGFFGSIAWWYNNWQGRIMPYILINAVLLFYQIFDSVLPLTIFLLSLYILSVYRILINLGLILKNKLLVINLIILSFAQIILTSFEPSTFYWVNVSTMYYGGMIFLLLGLSEVISTSKNIFSYVIIAISFFYAGCSSEHIGVLTSILMIGLIVYYHIQNNVILKNINKIKFVFATICCCVSFIIMYFAPGNEVRVSNYPRISIIESVPIAMDSFLILIKEILKRSFFIFVLSFPFVFLGIFNKKGRENEVLVKIIIKFTITVTIFLFIAMIPTAYATSTIGPRRALIYVNFLIVFYVIILAFILGKTNIINIKKIMLISVISVFIYIAILFNHFTVNLQSTIEFAAAHRKQILFLKKKKQNNNQEDIYLKPIYGKEGNLLWEDQLSSDPNYWLNHHIKEGLKLDFEIIGRDK